MNAFFYPLKRGFYFAEIQGGKVTAYTPDPLHFLPAFPQKNGHTLRYTHYKAISLQVWP